MSAASSVELEQAPAEQTQNDEIIYTSYQSLIKKLQETPSNQVFNLSLKWKDATRNKKDKKVVFVDDGPTDAYKRFIWGLLNNIIENILLGTSLYDMEMMSKVHSFLTTWEEDGYPGIIVINKNGIDKQIYSKYYAILLMLYESKGKRGDEKLIDPSIFVNGDGSLNLGNTPVMGILRDMICGCKRGTECSRGNKDHLTLLHRLPVSHEIRTLIKCSADYPVKGGKRRQTQYQKKTKANKRNTQKKRRKHRS